MPTQSGESPRFRCRSHAEEGEGAQVVVAGARSDLSVVAYRLQVRRQRHSCWSESGRQTSHTLNVTGVTPLELTGTDAPEVMRLLLLLVPGLLVRCHDDAWKTRRARPRDWDGSGRNPRHGAIRDGADGLRTRALQLTRNVSGARPAPIGCWTE